MIIDSDQIAFLPNGRSAWFSAPHPPALGELDAKWLGEGFDRHCKTCGGAGYVVEIINKNWDTPYGEPDQSDCPDCFNGRMSWQITAEQPCECGNYHEPSPGKFDCVGRSTLNFTVAVRPGVIRKLRAIGAWDDPNGPSTRGDGIYWLKGQWWQTIGPRAVEVAMPSGSKPGWWAVLLDLDVPPPPPLQPFEIEVLRQRGKLRRVGKDSG